MQNDWVHCGSFFFRGVVHSVSSLTHFPLCTYFLFFGILCTRIVKELFLAPVQRRVMSVSATLRSQAAQSRGFSHEPAVEAMNVAIRNKNTTGAGFVHEQRSVR